MGDHVLSWFLEACLTEITGERMGRVRDSTDLRLLPRRRCTRTGLDLFTNRANLRPLTRLGAVRVVCGIQRAVQ